ncbi:SAM-dependent methyltransferase, partial [Mycobacterium sp. ITM-2017-0098]
GRVGLLVYLATRHIPDDELPEGNHFPTAASLEGLFAESGFAVVEQQSAAELHDPPADWERRTDDVEA